MYGLGLIGEETGSAFKTYHFDFRGSTVAITDASGNITDTFAYDTYGKLVSRTGTSEIIFGYNGRDGVVTDASGLIYMRARYYSPELRRFINADVIPGEISNAVTLNRYAYANGNPVSNVDPFGLVAERGENFDDLTPEWVENIISGNASVEDYCMATVADPNDWEDLIREKVERAIDIALEETNNRCGGMPFLLYSEHKKRGTTSPSKRNKHQEGQSRRRRDQGEEKGDVRRVPGNPNKRGNGKKGTKSKKNSVTSADKLVAAGWIVAGVAGIVYIVFNDFTGVGVADDTLIPTAVGTVVKGFEMMFAQ